MGVNNVQSKQCAPAASAGTQAGRTTDGAVTVGDFRNRRIGGAKWYGSLAQRNSAGTHNIGSGQSPDRGRTASAMGSGEERIAGSGGNENSTCEAHNVRVRPAQDCGGSTGAVGSGEEGGIATSDLQ
jgi:hypothetical protein